MQNKGEFIHRLQASTGLAEKHEAEKVTQSVLHTLAKRLTPEEAKHVEAQLPEDLKPLWNGNMLQDLAHRMKGAETYDKQEFIDHVMKETGCSQERAEELTREVFHLLKEQITEGQAQHVTDQLPKALKIAWLEA